MNYKELNGVSIREAFNAFNDQNPHIYNEFESQALAAIYKGRTKISAKMIINYIRWNEYLRSSDKSFKINDAFQSYYARLFVERFPGYDKHFEFRKLRNEEPGPYMNVDNKGILTFE
jgi:hypothetical protein